MTAMANRPGAQYAGTTPATVHYEVDDHVARVTIDRPHVLNAVDEETERQLESLWQRIAQEHRDKKWVTAWLKMQLRDISDTD